jgi:hypothetical protein
MRGAYNDMLIVLELRSSVRLKYIEKVIDPTRSDCRTI